MISKKVKILLNLTGPLLKAVEDLFLKSDFRIVNSAEEIEAQSITHILIEKNKDISKVLAQKSINQDSIEIISLDTSGNYKNFLTYGGRVCISREVCLDPIGLWALERYTSQYPSYQLNKIFDGDFESATFKISGHMSLGYYADLISAKAFNSDYNVIKTRNYFINLLSYIAYLEKSQIAFLPVQVDFKKGENYFVIQTHLSVKNFYLDYLLESLYEEHKKNEVEALLFHAFTLTHLVELFYHKKSGKVVINAIWAKSDYKGPQALLIREIESFKQAQINAEILTKNIATPDVYLEDDQDINKADLESKNLPGKGVTSKSLRDGRLAKNPLALKRMIEFVFNKAQEKGLAEELDKINIATLMELLEEFPIEGVVENLDDLDKELILKGLKDPKFMQGITKAEKEAQDKIENDQGLKNNILSEVANKIKGLDPKLLEQISKVSIGGSRDLNPDEVNRVEGIFDQDKEFVRVQGKIDEDDEVINVEGEEGAIDLTEDNILVKGKREEIDDENVRVSGKKEEIDDDHIRVSGSKEEIDDDNVRVSGKKDDIDSSIQRINGVGESEEEDVFRVAGSKESAPDSYRVKGRSSNEKEDIIRIQGGRDPLENKGKFNVKEFNLESLASDVDEIVKIAMSSGTSLDEAKEQVTKLIAKKLNISDSHVDMLVGQILDEIKSPYINNIEKDLKSSVLDPIELEKEIRRLTKKSEIDVKSRDSQILRMKNVMDKMSNEIQTLRNKNLELSSANYKEMESQNPDLSVVKQMTEEDQVRISINELSKKVEINEKVINQKDDMIKELQDKLTQALERLSSPRISAQSASAEDSSDEAIAQFQEAIEEANHTISSLKKEVTTNKKLLTDKDSQLEKFKKHLENSEANKNKIIEDLEKRLEDLSKNEKVSNSLQPNKVAEVLEQKGTEVDLESANESINILRSEVHRVLEEMGDLEQQYEKYKSVVEIEKTELNEKIQSYELKLKQTKAGNLQPDDQVTTAQSTVDIKDHVVIQDMEEKNTNLQVKLKEAQDLITKLQNEKKTPEVGGDDGLKSKLVEQSKEISKLNKDLLGAEAKIREAELEVKRMEHKASTFESKLRAIESKSSATSRPGMGHKDSSEQLDAGKLQSKLKQMESVNGKLTENLKRTNDELTAKKSEALKMKQEMTQMQHKLADLERKFGQKKAG